jgi:hypothetical protein
MKAYIMRLTSIGSFQHCIENRVNGCGQERKQGKQVETTKMSQTKELEGSRGLTVYLKGRVDGTC